MSEANIQKNILALDLGKGSIGAAISRSGLFITPLENYRFAATHYEFALRRVKDIMEIERVETIAIGYPLFPSGDPCEMTPIVEDFILMLQKEFPRVSIIKVDERNSTVEAASLLHELGINMKKQKKVIDSAAAAVILKRYLVSIGQMD